MSVVPFFLDALAYNASFVLIGAYSDYWFDQHGMPSGCTCSPRPWSSR